MSHFRYTGSKTNQISFPLGGIGTGCIGLAGNGRLIDWEIFNRPNKGSVNGFSHFAIKAEAQGQVLDTRVLHGDLPTPFSGEMRTPPFESFGFGPRRQYLTGMPHFQTVDFLGEFPLAELTFQESAFPGEVVLRAFNPFIPLNDDDSGLPAAFFEFEITNHTLASITYTLAGILANPLPKNNLNTVQHANGFHYLHLATDGLEADDPAYGNLTLATDATEVSWQQYWFRGAWFDSLEVYWREFSRPGRLQNRVYEPAQAGDRNEGMLAAHVDIAAGQTKTVRFVITWHFPTCENYWREPARAAAEKAGISPTWKNYYATQWPNSQASANYALTHWDRLYTETRLFKETLFASTLPPIALEAISANLSTLKSPTVLRLEDGTLYGWEGVHPDEGCCEGTCTHVWNYAQTLPFLFPKLERSMREADYKYNLRPDGGMPFRLQLPLGTPAWNFRPCVDGQFGGVMKIYRDWKISGDTAWLQQLWPAVKKSIEFAWHPDNVDRWDPEKTGILWGRQHHTLDMELFGPNAWMTGFYLGALKAGAEMAQHLGETETAQTYLALFEKGKAWADKHLFNGEYYHQRIALDDKALIEQFSQADDALIGGAQSALEAYWNDEHQEIKYQIGQGCQIDQVLAQWHANLYGLGDLFDANQVQQANQALFRHNFKQSSRDLYNPCRIYSLNDEAGLTISVWPQAETKPMIPIPYAQETMNGFEYAAAIHMIQTGLITEGMQVVEAVRNRFDGEKRNPWNEIECGSNYARSMAAYALLNAFAGFEFDMVKQMVGFNPIQLSGGPFRCFWSLDSGWGEFVLTPETVALHLLFGQLTLQQIRLPCLADQVVQSVTIAGVPQTVKQAAGTLYFDSPVTIKHPANHLVVSKLPQG